MKTGLAIGVLAVTMIAAPALAQDVSRSAWTGFFNVGPVSAPAKPRKTRRLPGLSTIDLHGDRTLFTLHRTYQHDFGPLVVGGEINRHVDKAAIVGTGAAVEDTRHLRARIGYDAGNFLPYAVLGYSWQNTTDPHRSFRDEGAAFGIGAAYQINDWVVLGTELVDSDLAADTGYGLRDQLKTTVRFSLKF